MPFRALDENGWETGGENMAKKQPKPPPNASCTTLDAATKAQVEKRAQELIDKELKPKHVKPPPEDGRCNYLSDITLKWHGPTLFLVAVYACPGPNAISPSFEDRLARLRPAGPGRFDLSFMRHTGQWVELFQGQTLDECLESIKNDPWFTP
jgi:hypothetical protein